MVIPLVTLAYAHPDVDQGAVWVHRGAADEVYLILVGGIPLRPTRRIVALTPTRVKVPAISVSETTMTDGRRTTQRVLCHPPRMTLIVTVSAIPTE